MNETPLGRCEGRVFPAQVVNRWGVRKRMHAEKTRGRKQAWKIGTLVFFWIWVFVAALRLPLVALSRGFSLLWRAGFSLLWLLSVQSTGSRCSGFNSCGPWAW